MMLKQGRNWQDLERLDPEIRGKFCQGLCGQNLPFSSK